MAQSGWISIRNVPKVFPKNKIAESAFYHKLLASFFERYTLCPECRGKGKVRQSQREVKDTIIKFKGIPDLEVLHKCSDVPMAEVIREILAIQLEGLTVCPTCEGHRFLERRQDDGED